MRGKSWLDTNYFPLIKHYRHGVEAVAVYKGVRR
jgi:hypothetical protein